MLGMRAAARQHHGWCADGHGATDAHLYGDPSDAAVPALLDSRFDGDKFDALNHLLALIAQDVDVSYLFPQAVKNVVAQSLELKMLVPSTSTSACSTTPRELPTLIWCAPVCSVSDCDAPRNIKPYIQSMVATPLGISQEIFRYPLQAGRRPAAQLLPSFASSSSGRSPSSRGGCDEVHWPSFEHVPSDLT